MKGFERVSKGLLYEKWVGGWTELQYIDPHSYGHNSVSFPFSWAAQPGAWEPSLSGTYSSFQHLLSNWSSLQLIWTSCRQGYIIIWYPLFFLRASQFRTQFNHSTVKVISWYSSTGCTCYLHRCISCFDSLAGSEVNIQQMKSLNSPEVWGSIPVRVKKWYLMPLCLYFSIIIYRARINGTIQGKEYCSLVYLGVVAIEKGAFGSPSTTVGHIMTGPWA